MTHFISKQTANSHYVSRGDQVFLNNIIY